MLSSSQQAPSMLDARIAGALDRAGLVGSGLREDLIHDIKAKVVLRRGRDAIELIGAAGTGKHSVADVVHTAACELLGRSGPMHVFSATNEQIKFEQSALEALDQAKDGTLVIERFDELSESRREQLARMMRARSQDTLLVAISETELPSSNRDARPATAIRLKPLHEREEDIWELIEHFFDGLREDENLSECEGFSRQAKADLAEAIRETNLSSVRRLSEMVRDVVYETLADGPLPLKLTSEHVRPYLERCFGQTEGARQKRDADLLQSQFDASTPEQQDELLVQLAELHGVSPALLRREVEVLREVVDSVNGVPRSYRNIMTKAEDIQRAAMWLLTQASTQADFRRFFGEEGFMRPTKSVAWAFYNRVFQRET